MVTAVSQPSAPSEKATVQDVDPGAVDGAFEADQAVQDVRDAIGQARVADHPVLVGADDDQSEGEGTGAHEDEVGERAPAAARIGQGGELAPVAQQWCEQREGDDDADDRVAVGELGDGTRLQQRDGSPPRARRLRRRSP